ncbi:MAG: IS200/IS605 family transposase [Ferruginibacter sp.]
MSFTNIWIHLVWATKNRELILTNEVRPKIFAHMKQNAKSKNIHLDTINGYLDHVHCLISINTEQTISKIVQLIKGESSYWINKNKLMPYKFEWQNEYFAASVSESGVNRVRNYIENQEEHHKKKTFLEEYEEFISKNSSRL